MRNRELIPITFDYKVISRKFLNEREKNCVGTGAEKAVILEKDETITARQVLRGSQRHQNRSQGAKIKT